MPKDLHKDLDKRAREKGLKPGSDEYNRYVYGTLKKVEKRSSEKEEVEIEDPPFN